MIKKPVISVIVPLYNAESEIEKCLKSIIASNLSNMEIIVIDDCSTDNSCDIVEKIINENASDKKILLIKNEKNLGCAITRNNGINLAQGKYIGFVDNDDYIEYDYFSKMVEKIEKENGDVCVSLKIINHKNQKAIKHLLDCSCDLKEAVFVDRTAPWAKIYKKDFLIENGIKFDNSRGEDIYPAFCEAYFANKITYINDSHYHCNIKKGSISHSRTTIADIEEIKIYKKIIDFIQKNVNKNKKSYWMKLVKKRALISVDFLYSSADYTLKNEIKKEYEKIFTGSNFNFERVMGKIFIRLKRLETFLRAVGNKKSKA